MNAMKTQLAAALVLLLNHVNCCEAATPDGSAETAVAPACAVNVNRAKTPLFVGHAFALETASEIAPLCAAKSAAEDKLHTAADPDGTIGPSCRALASSSRRASTGYCSRNDAPEIAWV